MVHRLAQLSNILGINQQISQLSLEDLSSGEESIKILGQTLNGFCWKCISPAEPSSFER
jgi:hypothetical protein